MHLSTLQISGYKLFRERFEARFEKGLTVLVGENGTGKTAVIDALRLLLLEDEYGRGGVSPSDFYRSVNDLAKSNGVARIELRCTFDGLDDKMQAAYLPWLDIRDTQKALLTLIIENREDQRGRLKRDVWGGESASSAFEWELLGAISCAYLPALRDAEAKLSAYRGSRLARLLRNIGQRRTSQGEKHPLEGKVTAFNDQLLNDPTIRDANAFIRKNVGAALGPVFGQDAMIQFSEARFERIVEQLRLLFYPMIPPVGQSTEKGLFRELAENSLGLNNVLYLATVLAELEDLGTSQTFLKMLLIEEPEAHLHPQLQVKLLQYLHDKASESDIQVIVTTHSPTIAASVGLNTIKVLTRRTVNENPVLSSIAHCGLTPIGKFFLERWLDVTKSTLLFAKSVILVEGIAEALVVPELARLVLSGLNPDTHGHELRTLKDYGVSVIDMGGIYFTHFMQLFKGYTHPQGKRLPCDKIPIRCAGITDCDCESEAAPIASAPAACKNPQYYLVAALANHVNCRLFCNLKTFEYDLAVEGNNLQLMAEVYLQMKPNSTWARGLSHCNWAVSSDEEKAVQASVLLKRVSDCKGEFAQFLALKLSASTSTSFRVPEYIELAVKWAVGVV